VPLIKILVSFYDKNSNMLRFWSWF